MNCKISPLNLTPYNNTWMWPKKHFFSWFFCSRQHLTTLISLRWRNNWMVSKNMNGMQSFSSKVCYCYFFFFLSHLICGKFWLMDWDYTTLNNVKVQNFLRRLQKWAQLSLWFWNLHIKHQNHKGDCAHFCGLLRKAELYCRLLIIYDKGCIRVWRTYLFDIFAFYLNHIQGLATFLIINKIQLAPKGITKHCHIKWTKNHNSK